MKNYKLRRNHISALAYSGTANANTISYIAEPIQPYIELVVWIENRVNEKYQIIYDHGTVTLMFNNNLSSL